jgi:hypothetical protein
MGQKLTERQQVTTSDSNDLIHVVRNSQSYQMKTDLLVGQTTIENTTGNYAKGGVSWSGTGLVYNVWVSECGINSTVYNTLVSGQVTLSAGDATNPRIDKFVIEVNAFASPPTFEIKAVEGTPAASPLEPSINLVNQAEISFRITAANETTDPVTQIETIYDENTGESAEWDNDNIPSGANLDYATDPYQGTKCLYVPSVQSDAAQWTNDSLITFNGSDSLVFALRANLSTSAQFQVKLINSSSGAYYLKTLKYSDLNKFGGKTSEVNWQLIQVKLSDFAPSSKSNTQYDSIEITFIKIPNLSIDWLHIQSELSQPSNPNKFTDLSDTPNDYNGQAGLVAVVNSNEDGIEFVGAGSGLPSGSDTQVQFNNAGAFGASNRFVWDDTNKTLVLGDVNSIASGLGGSYANLIIGDSDSDVKGNAYGNIIGGNNIQAGTLGAALGDAVLFENIIGGWNTTVPAAKSSLIWGQALLSSSARVAIVGVANVDLTQTVANNLTGTGISYNPRLIVGVGDWNSASNTGTRKNGLVVMSDGVVSAPEQSISNIDSPTVPTGASASFANRVLITKEYADVNYKLQSYTVATLPSGSEGDVAYVTDATAPTYLGTLTGGGAVKCPVFYNGTAWVSH